jgi:hypothetical protein
MKKEAEILSENRHGDGLKCFDALEINLDNGKAGPVGDTIQIPPENSNASSKR